MTTINTAYQNAAAHGVAAFELLPEYVQGFLLAGAEPALQPTTRVLLGDSKTLVAFSVVGLSSGKLVLATDAIPPVGVLLHAATSGATNTTIYGEVFLSGCFNIDADSPLVWHSSLDTEAERTANNNANLIFRRRL